MVSDRNLEAKFNHNLQELLRKFEGQRAEIVALRQQLQAAPQHDTAPTCQTCGDNGIIGGPSYCAPDEGGEPCPDCNQPDTVAVELEGWKDCAAQMSRNADFYRGIVEQIGEMFGEPAYTSDDGSVQDDVLALKVPELVRALLDQEKLITQAERFCDEHCTWADHHPDCTLLDQEKSDTVAVERRQIQAWIAVLESGDHTEYSELEATLRALLDQEKANDEG